MALRLTATCPSLKALSSFRLSAPPPLVRPIPSLMAPATPARRFSATQKGTNSTMRPTMIPTQLPTRQSRPSALESRIALASVAVAKPEVGVLALAPDARLASRLRTVTTAWTASKVKLTVSVCLIEIDTASPAAKVRLTTLSKVSTVGDRHRLSVGTEVFYRNKQKNTEGEGILCSVTSVIGEGKQRRYIYFSQLKPTAEC